MADANSREARRRRRILQQGSDRLAFIKGRIETLPPPTVLPHNETEAEAEAEEDSNSVLQNHDDDASKSTITQTPPLLDSKQHEGESEISTSEVEPEPEHVQAQPPITPPDSSLETSQSQQHPRERESFIITSDLSSAINASRVTRLCCSAIVALLVVASYLGFSLLGTQLIRTVISFRPLYLVLLTNSTVVVARLVSGRSKRRRQNSTTTSSSEWDAQLATALEMGLVLQSVLDAVFMDCAVYAIVLICGLSLVHT